MIIGASEIYLLNRYTIKFVKICEVFLNSRDKSRNRVESNLEVSLVGLEGSHLLMTYDLIFFIIWKVRKIKITGPYVDKQINIECWRGGTSVNIPSF